MLGESPASPLGPRVPSESPAPPPRWLLPTVLALILAGAAGLAWSRGWFSSTPVRPLDGELLISVRPQPGGRDGMRLDEAGALPVRTGGSMIAEVHFNQPAYPYVVWLDTEGRVLPLYPWNDETLDVTDINRPPPVRRAGMFVSPMTIGSGWKFGQKGGMETVLLLARRTPPGDSSWTSLFATPLPVAKVQQPNQFVVLGVDASNPVVKVLAQNRGGGADATSADEPLRALIKRLHEHFEFVRVVQFAHSDE